MAPFAANSKQTARMLDHVPSPLGYGTSMPSTLRPMERKGPRTIVRRHRSRLPRRDLAAAFGERIRSLRSGKAMSQAQLGAPYFTRAHVSAIELGKILPAITTLAHFARKLGVPLRELIPPGL